MRSLSVLIMAILVLLLTFSGVALAAAPQDVYNDYAADGDLDGSYSKVELQAYLDDATVHQYGDSATVTALDNLVTTMLSSGSPGSGDDDNTRSEFPFTGWEASLYAAAAAALLLTGFGLRRATR